MKITVINGTEKHGVTWRLKEIFLERFREKEEITEFYLPEDCPCFCMGCADCIFKGGISARISPTYEKLRNLCWNPI